MPDYFRQLIYLIIIVIHRENSKKSLLWHLNRAHLLHPFLALFLFFQKFSFSGYIAAIAFGRNIFAYCADGFAGDDLRADRSLARNVKLVLRAQFVECFT